MILLLAFSLGVDAFAVSTSCGIQKQGQNRKNIFVLAFMFGLFQAGMSGLGVFLSEQFGVYIETFGPLLAFIILFAIGAKMIWEAWKGTSEEKAQCLNFKTIILLSIATSIDAFAAGIGLRFLTAQLLLACILIGIVAYLMSFMGVLFGQKLGKYFEKSAMITGGLVLIVLGIRALLSGNIPFF